MVVRRRKSCSILGVLSRRVLQWKGLMSDDDQGAWWNKMKLFHFNSHFNHSFSPSSSIPFSLLDNIEKVISSVFGGCFLNLILLIFPRNLCSTLLIDYMNNEPSKLSSMDFSSEFLLFPTLFTIHSFVSIDWMKL
jgi:hypothetical protein